MKPYTLLAEHQESQNLTYGLYERDGVQYYQVNSQPIASSKESNCEYEIAQMIARPFRPARQPRFLIIGLGIGVALNALSETIPQQKAVFDVIDLNPKSFDWFKKHLVQDPEASSRIEFSQTEVAEFTRPNSDTYHGIFVDPELWRSYGSGEDLVSKPYINYFVNSLKMGGLLGMVTERPDKIVLGRMERSGLEVSVERISAVPGGKRQRTIWLAKKGHYRKKD